MKANMFCSNMKTLWTDSNSKSATFWRFLLNGEIEMRQKKITQMRHFAAKAPGLATLDGYHERGAFSRQIKNNRLACAGRVSISQRISILHVSRLNSQQN